MKQDEPDNSAALANIRRHLLDWYHPHRRDLPWRVRPGDTPDPYRVLVSEAMLQQTQVATVVPYFERFMAAFPTVEALAGAEEGEVLRLWQGLGYYSRARRLHAAAGVIVQELGGRVPGTVEGLLALPGVGRYTAGAVASIAFGVPAPIVDGNVERVLTRVMLWDRPVDDPETKRRLWEWAEMLAAGEQPGDVNQAVMDLGALVCVPASPNCLLCPLAGVCRARAAGREGEVPVKPPRRAKRAAVHEVVAVRKGDRYFFERRPGRGMWAGMWQMPTREGAVEGTPTEDAGRLEAWIQSGSGLVVSEAAELGRFDHATTHRAIRFVVWHADLTAGRLRAGAGQWRRLDRLDDLPLANPQRRAVSIVMTAHGRTVRT